MSNVIFLIIFNFGVLFSFNMAVAYVGPGIGITLLNSLWGFIAIFGLSLVGISFWPIRKLLRMLMRKVRRVSK